MAAPATDPDPRLDTTMRVAPGDGETMHLAVHGELDLATWAAFRDLLVSVADLWPRVVIDASGLTFCDARGLAALVAGAVRAERRGGRITLAHLRPNVAKVLRLAGLDRRFGLLAQGLRP
ncbi:STAS domain-containing protein [Actinomadura rubteroloni]|nr:STAS domain-containing protein [Actinomadura rubteroloni]